MLRRHTPPTSTTATTATTAAIPRVGLSLLTAVCLACPPAAAKAAEPAAAAAEPANTEPANTEPTNTEPNTEPAPQTAPLYLNPGPAPAPATQATMVDFDTAREAAGIPKWSGTGLLSAGIVTTALGLVPTLVYVRSPATPWSSAREGTEDPFGYDYIYEPASPAFLGFGIPLLVGGVAMTTLGALRWRRYRDAVDEATARGRSAHAHDKRSSVVEIARSPEPPSGGGMLGGGIALLAAGGIAWVSWGALESLMTGWNPDDEGQPDLGRAMARVGGLAPAMLMLPPGIALTAVGAMRRGRHQLWLRSRYEAPGPPPPSISLHGGAVVPMSIRPGVAYGRPVRTYGFQVKF